MHPALFAQVSHGAAGSAIPQGYCFRAVRISVPRVPCTDPLVPLTGEHFAGTLKPISLTACSGGCPLHLGYPGLLAIRVVLKDQVGGPPALSCERGPGTLLVRAVTLLDAPLHGAITRRRLLDRPSANPAGVDVQGTRAVG